MRRTLKYRLYSSKHDIFLHRRISIAGQIWNHALALQKKFYAVHGKYISLGRMQKHIAKLRNGCKSWWQMLGSQAIQQVCERLDKAFKRFFQWSKKKTGRKSGFPRFKKTRHFKSFTLKQWGWKLLEGNRVRILGRTFKFVKSREVTGTIKTVTIKRDNLDRLWICFSVTEELPEPISETGNTAAGFDFGLKTFLTTDDGSTIEHPRFERQNAAKIAKCNRELARKKKGSNNRKQAKRRLAKAHSKSSDQRRDWMFKTSHELCNKADQLFFEDLNIDGMKRLWGRKVSDLAFSEFVSILKHVANKRGKRVVQIGRFVPSSKTCSNCGQIKQTLELSERVFDCDGCGHQMDRDQNAAINIKQVGASTCELDDVRLASPAVVA